MTTPPTPSPASGFDALPAGVDRALLGRYLAACAAMLLVLVGAVVYGVFIHHPALPPSTETVAAGGEAVDGPLAFVVTDIEIGTTVSSTEAPVRKDPAGEFVVVRLWVTNISDAPAQFTGSLQRLFAGGTEYTADEEASFYVNGGLVEIPPGAEAHVGVAFDVPAGTVPEFVDLHADAMSPGVQIPLS